jgi:hypothetical protein
VLTQIGEQAGTGWTVRSAPLIQPASPPTFKWRRIGTKTDPLPRLKRTTHVVDCSTDLAKPGTWRYDGGLACTLEQVALSQDGHQLLGANADGSLFHRRFSTEWSQLAPLAPLQLGFKDIAISTAATADQSTDGVAQLLAIGGDGLLSHRLRYVDGTWTNWAIVPSLNGGGQVAAKRCAIAVEGPHVGFLAQVCVIASDTTYLHHMVRLNNGLWTDLQKVPGRPNTSGMLAKEVAVATCYDQQYALVAVVDVNQRVQVTLRRPNGQWDAWAQVNLPQRQGVSLSAQFISLVGSPDPGGGQLLVKCNDGQLYQGILAFNNAGAVAWRQVPYPQAPPYEVWDVALGRAVGGARYCDPPQSVAVWTVGDLPGAAR